MPLTEIDICCKIPRHLQVIVFQGFAFKNNKLDRVHVFVVKSPACVSFC